MTALFTCSWVRVRVRGWIVAKIRILTLAEQRDEAIDNRLAGLLRNMGHDTEVRHYAMAGCETVTYEKPDIIVHPMVGAQSKLNFVRLCHRWGVGVVVRRGEAGVTADVFANLPTERKAIIVGNWDYTPYVDLELTWGSEFSDLLAAERGMPRNRIVPCGPFTLDLVYGRQRAYNRAKRTILWATAWSAADDVEEFSECGVEPESPFHRQLYRQHRQGRDRWLYTIHSFYLRYAHRYHFLLKVRPGEMTREYQDKLGKCVEVLPYDTPSGEALARCDAVIHAGSTLAVEAHLMGIPSINYTNCNPDPRVAELTIQCHDDKELADALVNLDWDHSNIDMDRYQWLVDHLYGPVDGLACERAAIAIDALAKSRKKHKTNIPVRWSYEVQYPSEAVSLTRDNSHPATGLCVQCKGHFWHIGDSGKALQCPYCGINLRWTGSQRVKRA